MDKVLNDLVPAMTSNNTPSGEVVFGSRYHPENYCPHFAFDKIISTWNDVFISDLYDVTTAYIGYHFENPVVVKKIKYVSRNNGGVINNGVPKSYSIESSNDGNNWIEIGIFENSINEQSVTFEQSLDNNTPYLFYRMKANSLHGNYFGANELYFYGR